ncbi:MAG: hypothetical protein QM535_04295 [Limnohabitans sp.]|nr:hypothetical protein [Limnohabitans sp.]
MKQLILFFSAFIFSSISIAQSTATLDEKKGFMDLKIGNPISQYSDNVYNDDKDSSVYHIKDLSKYNIDNREIKEIQLYVSKDSKKTIEQIVFSFEDRLQEYMEKARDEGENLDKRIEYGKLAENIAEQGTDLSYYYNLFLKAFGTPKIESQIHIWKGKKIQLIYTKIKGDGYGAFMFSRIYTPEELKKSKQDEAKKAAEKF